MCRNPFYVISFILVFGLVLLSAAEAQDDPNLIGWWKMDETSGTVAADSSGYGNDGTVVGGAEFVSGYIDGAIDLDGDDDYVDCGYDPIFDTAGEMSVAAWITVRSIPTAWACVIAKGEYSWRLSNENMDQRFHFGITIWSASNPSISGDTVIGSDEWHHVAGTFDGDNINVYLDGSLDATVATSSPIGVNAANVLIGENPEAAGRNWDGLIDDVRLYNRALSASDLSELMPTQLKATLSDPSDKAVLSSTDIILSWTAGETASRHRLFIGQNYEDVENGTGDTEVGLLSQTSFDGYEWEIGNTYYWRVEEAQSNGAVIHPGDVWSFTILPLTASKPIPADLSEYVNTDVTLQWTAGAGAVEHHVYFHENPMAVLGRDPDADMGTVEEPNFSPGQLDYNKEYFWMVDEIDGRDTHPGSIWSFMTVGPNNGAKAEYFNNSDLAGNPILIRIDPRIDFDWAEGSPDPLVSVNGFSVRWTAELEIPVDDTYTFYSISDDNARLWIDGQLLVDNWDSDNAWAIEEAESIYLEAGWVSLRMEFFDDAGDAIAQLKWESSTIPRQAISPAALSIPVRATTPNPSNGYAEVENSPIIGWASGDKAAQHDVYFGTDYNEVASADVTTSGIYRGRQDLDNTEYMPTEAPLDWNTTYYWRIDEVNDAEPNSPWTGKIWNFTIGNFVVIEDFESYGDYPPDEVWNVWLDGYDDPTNGSSAGYPDPDFVAGEHYLEDTIVRTGLFSMPVFYDNSTARLSEVTRTFDSATRNWTVDDVVTLTLFYQGDPNNVVEPMYIVVDNVVVTNDDADAALAEDWTRWDILLQSLADEGVNLNAVGSMTIGFGDKDNPASGGGAGHVFFDDIRLYRPE
jgi:hypothetical protein